MASPKALIELLGDSETRGYGLPDIATQSIKAAFDHYLQGLVDVGLHGYDGYQSSALGPKFTSDVLPELDATRVANILVALGGANDILGSTGDAPTIAGRLQTVLNNAKSEALTNGITLKTGITELFSVSSALGTWDESLKNSVNALIANNSFTADFKGNSQADAILGSQTEMAKLAWTVDGLHPNAAGNLRRALYVDLPVIGQLDNLPLIAVFDFPKTQYSSDENIIPFNVPFGGNQADTKTWEWKIVGGSVLSTSQNPTFPPQAPGDYDIQLKVSTPTNGNQTVVRSISVVAPGNVGSGSISPAFPTPAPSVVVPMVVSGVTSPKIFILSGGGSISGISGNDFNFNAPASGDTVIKAEEEMWGSSAHAISQDDNSVTWNSADGYAASSVARFTAIGDGLEETLTSNFLATAGNKLAIANTGSGNTFALIVVNSTHVKINTTGGGDETTLTVAAGDKISLEIGSGSHILVRNNGTLVYTTTSTYDSLLSFPMLVFFIMLATISMPRPRFYGAGITSWNSGESDSTVVIVPPSVLITDPLPGASVKGTITINATAQATAGITSVQFKVGGANIGSADTSSPFTASLDTTSLSDGLHSLTAVLLTADSQTIISPAVSINVDNTSPIGIVTNPSDGKIVQGTITLETNAEDASGIGGIQYKVDGSNFGSEVTDSPFTADLNTTGLSEGGHTVSAVIRDALGNNITTPTVNFLVGNNIQGVAIQAEPLANIQVSTTGWTLRAYVPTNWHDVYGNQILDDEPDDKEAYFSADFTSLNRPAIILPATTNSPDNPNVRFSILGIYDKRGNLKFTLLENFFIRPDIGGIISLTTLINSQRTLSPYYGDQTSMANIFAYIRAYIEERLNQ